MLSSVWQIGANSCGFINVIQIKGSLHDEAWLCQINWLHESTSVLCDVFILLSELIYTLGFENLQTFKEFRFETANFLRHFNKCIIVRCLFSTSPSLPVSLLTRVMFFFITELHRKCLRELHVTMFCELVFFIRCLYLIGLNSGVSCRFSFSLMESEGRVGSVSLGRTIRKS